MSSVHRVYPRFLCRLAATVRCAGAPAPPGAARERALRAPRVPARRDALVASLATTTLALAGCGDVPGLGADSAVDETLRFEGSAPSLGLLAEHALDALVRGDTVALARFRLTEQEHNEVVWPELPASAPEVSFPVDYAWQNIEARNLRSLLRIVPTYRDRPVDFQGVECRGETRAFQTFLVHTDCWVVFGDEGRERWETQLFKDVLERGGGYKIFRFYDEGPRRYRGPVGP